ncbi:twin-arginine translocase TatA/TatE family subunit [Rubrobacter marinus]|uniref:Sec-independent protein translocase protein TatA n=1 Tax=Rubrobacter marinus TaxID=2653852 RepID=A0A6G8Q2Q6_9ACTN|nr:twin-arginine translocase TatA/TatE family subunit [Rubrobacter marinus]
MPNLGPTELLIILTIVLLLFGTRRVPDLARSLGTGVRELHKGLQEDHGGQKERPGRRELEEDDAPPAKTPREAGPPAARRKDGRPHSPTS